MCFGIPCKVRGIKKNKATVLSGSKIFDVDISLLPKIKLGDWILTQGDIGLKKISGQEAKELLSLLNPQKNQYTRGKEEVGDEEA